MRHWSFFASPAYLSAVGSFLTPPPQPEKQVPVPAQVEQIVFKKAA